MGADIWRRAAIHLLGAATVGVLLGWPAQSVVAGAGVSLEERLELFRQAYRDVIETIDDTHVILRDGSKFRIDDGEDKNHHQRLTSADIEDMLSQVYPVLACMKITEKPVRNFDPGRIRNDRFFKSVYGQSEKDVRSELESVPWFGRRLAVTRRMGVSAALRDVARELEAIEDLDMRFVRSMGGTFNWRPIAGTKRLSVHSFGAAVDLNTKLADYWRWSGGKPGNVPKYVNRVPANIVAAFEKHGFIWGGRWYHYDTMHFEYRPALIAIGRLAQRRGCSADGD